MKTRRQGVHHQIESATRHAPQPRSGETGLGMGREFWWIEMSCGDTIRWADPYPHLMDTVLCRDCGAEVRVLQRWTLPPDERVQAREVAFEAFAKGLADGHGF